MELRKTQFGRRPCAFNGKAILTGAINASSRQARRSPRAMSTSRNCTRENRETSPASGAYQPPDRHGKPKHNPCMHGGEESNIGVVPAKPPNKAGRDTSS